MSELGFRKFVNTLAFIGIIACAISIIISKWVPFLGEIGGWIGIFVMAVSAFLFVKAKRSPVYMLIYILSVAVIIGFKIWILL